MAKKKIVKVKILPQTGRTKNIPMDIKRRAKLPGRRLSKKGKIYWETRRNRSDAPGSRI